MRINNKIICIAFLFLVSSKKGYSQEVRYLEPSEVFDLNDDVRAIVEANKFKLNLPFYGRGNVKYDYKNEEADYGLSFNKYSFITTPPMPFTLDYTLKMPNKIGYDKRYNNCLLYTSPSPRDA